MLCQLCHERGQQSEPGRSQASTSVCGRLSFAGRLRPCLHDDGSLLVLQVQGKGEGESRFPGQGTKAGQRARQKNKEGEAESARSELASHQHLCRNDPRLLLRG